MDSGLASVSLVQFLFGIVCALWAQNTERSAWLWFFCGWLLAPITGVILLIKNSKDRNNTKYQV